MVAWIYGISLLVGQLDISLVHCAKSKSALLDIKILHENEVQFLREHQQMFLCYRRSTRLTTGDLHWH